jgi:hypothetical protein
MKKPRLTLCGVAIGLMVATAVEFLLAIWTGDVRWVQTAVVTAVPTVCAWLGWLGTVTLGTDHDKPSDL